MFILSTDFIVQLDDRWRQAIADDRLPWWIGLIRLFFIVLPYYFYGWVPQKVCEWCFRRPLAGAQRYGHTLPGHDTAQASPWAMGVVVVLVILIAGVLCTAVLGLLFGKPSTDVSVGKERITSSTPAPTESRPEHKVVQSGRVRSIQEVDRSRKSIASDISRHIRALGSMSQQQRDSSFQSLKQIGEPAVPYLIEALKKNGNSVVRYSAANLLYLIDNNVEDSVPVLVEALNDQSSTTVIWATETLGSMGADAKDAVAPLLQRATGDRTFGRPWGRRKESIRDVVTEALTKIGPAALPVLQSSLDDNNRWIRYISAAAILRIRESGENEKAHSTLRGAAKEDDSNARIWAVQQFAGIGALGVPDLVKVLRFDKDSSVRNATALALGKIGSQAKEAVPFLAEALGDRNIQLTALEALRKIGIEAKSAIPAIEAYRAKLGRYSSYIGIAEKTLDLIGEAPKSILLESLIDEEASIRAAGARLLGKKGPEAHDTIAKLGELLRYDDDEYVRASAAWSLGEMGPHAKDAVPFLIKALTDSHRGVQAVSVEALGKIGSEAKSAVPAIETWEKERPKYYQFKWSFGTYRLDEVAKKALERIRGL